MRPKDLERYEIFKKLMAKELTQLQAAQLLQLSERQIRRLLRRFEAENVEGLLPRYAARKSPRAYQDPLKQTVIALIRAHYADFGPTLAAEKLLERHGYHISKETLRRWMAENGLWTSKTRKRSKVFELRPRRAAYGELVQMDGSVHDWFEGRAPCCTLLVMIDDATGRLQALRFVPSESTSSYFEILEQYLGVHGKPSAFYTDKHGVFNVNAKEAQSGTGLTQFGRALKQLGIEAIFAHSPQAKGRVERVNGVLQDRLIKELRLQNISTIEAANHYATVFCHYYNQRFAKKPSSSINAHLRLTTQEQAYLPFILSLHFERKISKNLSIQFENKTYQLKLPHRRNRLQHKVITVIKSSQGVISLCYKGETLPYEVYDKGYQVPTILDSKELNPYLDSKKKSLINPDRSILGKDLIPIILEARAFSGPYPLERSYPVLEHTNNAVKQLTRHFKYAQIPDILNVP